MHLRAGCPPTIWCPRPAAACTAAQRLAAALALGQAACRCSHVGSWPTPAPRPCLQAIRTGHHVDRPLDRGLTALPAWGPRMTLRSWEALLSFTATHLQCSMSSAHAPHVKWGATMWRGPLSITLAVVMGSGWEKATSYRSSGNSSSTRMVMRRTTQHRGACRPLSSWSTAA